MLRACTFQVSKHLQTRSRLRSQRQVCLELPNTGRSTHRPLRTLSDTTRLHMKMLPRCGIQHLVRKNAERIDSWSAYIFCFVCHWKLVGASGPVFASDHTPTMIRCVDTWSDKMPVSALLLCSSLRSLDPVNGTESRQIASTPSQTRPEGVL